MFAVLRVARRFYRKHLAFDWNSPNDEVLLYLVTVLFAFLYFGFPNPWNRDLGALRFPALLLWMSFAVVATLLAGRLVLWLYRAAKRARRSIWESTLFWPIRAADAAIRQHLIPPKDASQTDVWLYGVAGFIAFMAMAGLTRVVLIRAPGVDVFPVLAVWIVLWIEVSIVVAMATGTTTTWLARSIARGIARRREETNT